MKLVFFREKVPNFGDELNTLVWPALLPPGFLDEDETDLFVGIGSIIGDHLPKRGIKHIVGSGYGGYSGLPNMADGTWDVRFVRGPQTARMLGLPPETSVCDGAVLLRAIDKLPEPAGNVGIGFMPHYQSLQKGLWDKACTLAGITLIDPTRPVETVLSQVRGARLLVTEAMHGAIVADALRVPWVAARPLFWGHHMKWQDWSEALDIDLRFHPLWPTTLLEMYIARTGRGGSRGRALAISRSSLGAPANAVLTYFAARRLRVLAGKEPQLSSDAKIAEVTERALAALDGLLRSRAMAG